MFNMCFFVFPLHVHQQPFPCSKPTALVLLIRCLVFVVAMAAAPAQEPEASAGFALTEAEACLTQPEKTEPTDAGSAASNKSDAIVTGSDKQAVQEPAALVAKPADSDQMVDVAGEEHKVTCRRCAQAVERLEALETPKFRPELRWTCKACHACQTQLARHGIEIKTLLNESEAVTFFAEARAERENSIDKRLTYAQARGMLKQAMVESSSREDREGSHGAFQPLAYYELKGYDTQRIEELAEYREHPILGATYRVDITKKSTEFISKLTEERIVRQETEFRQKQERAAVNVTEDTQPQLRLDLPAADPEPVIRLGTKRKTPEEKKEAQEAAKAQKAEVKKRLKLETAAVSAAGKFLPNLQKVDAKLCAAVEKACQVRNPLPEDLDRLVSEARAAVALATANAAKMLSGAAKGQGLATMDEAALLNDKGTQEVLKKANTAVRSLQEFCRENKENAAGPKAAARKGKKQ